ncbi:MAG: NADH-quinone oxidoreductase subunit L [Hyphomicrobiales bacterium]|nr:MAG: NADH-quinone oxidoreductase subunit L [Hyphomicrobiales bacterium]
MYTTIVFLPLLGAILAGFFGRFLGVKASEVITSGFVLLGALLSWIAFFQIGVGGETAHVTVLPWIKSGGLSVDWALRIDTLTAVMMVVVNTVSGLVHVYSIGYMHHDPHRTRFFSYLSLFTFAMLMLVTSDNFLQMFFGWEGVGLASYLLIGFWYQKPSANAAAIKAFVVNRVGDFGFALGIFGVYAVFGSIDYDTVFAAAAEKAGQEFSFLGMQLDIVTTLCVLLFMGAMGKSAQFLLHTWLPDAMEGPTPVSALIHAATMVTAGVFLVARCAPMFELSVDARFFVVLVGATTAFFAATVGLVQNDIKRVVAYSTCSQLGYMFVAAGVGAYGAAIFHLFTHAFFKALLFLGSGSVIHAMSDEQDMRHMGGLFPHLKKTWVLMLVGTLALTGFPLTAGYFSKDAIIESAYAAHSNIGMYAFVLTVIAAALTSFYSWRLMFMTFHGKPRASDEVMSHVHESPWVMLAPLVVLALGALGAGFLFSGYFIGEHNHAFWAEAIRLAKDNTILEDIHHVPSWVKAAPFVMMVGGLAVASLFYLAKPDLPVRLATRMPRLYKFLLNKWYFDELFDWMFVRPAFRIGRTLWKTGDGAVIDGLGPDGVAARVLAFTGRAVRMQSGFVYHYAFAMLIGVAFLITYVLFNGI